MADINLPYLSEDPDRHGNERFYVRVRGRRERLHGEPGTVAFLEAYTAALARLKGDDKPVKARAAAPETNTLAWLGQLYFASAEFRRLAPASQRNRRSILESCFAEPKKPGDAVLIGQCPLPALNAAIIKILRDRRADQPGAANNRLKYLSSMFAWAIEDDKMKHNPARDVKPIKYASDGFHTWTEDEIEIFEARWPRGTRQRLAMAVLLYTGARPSDAAMLGRQHRRKGKDGDEHVFVPAKTKRLKSEPVHIPVLPIFDEELAGAPTGDLTYIVTEYGHPFSAKGFSQWFSEQCTRAGLPLCTAHGLRKAGASILAERGATDRQLMAIFNWSSEKQATTYTRSADRSRMARAAMPLLNRTPKNGN